MEPQWDPLFVQAPLPNRFGEDGLTYFLGPRMVAYQAKPDLSGEDQTVEESLDVIPLSVASTATDDPADRFFRTLERTARMSVLEDAEFETSTLSLIGETDISEIGDIEEYDFDAYENSGTDYYDLRDHADFYHQETIQFGPTDGSELAMWNVHTPTGTVHGLLPDGTGGAKRQRPLNLQTCEAELDQFAAISQLYLILFGPVFSGAGAFALSVIVSYYLELSLLYLEATVAVGSITSDNPQSGPGMEGLTNLMSQTAESAAVSVIASRFRIAETLLNVSYAARAAGPRRGPNDGCS
jgi:hypothetical protein